MIEDVLIDTGFSNTNLEQLKKEFQINKVLFTHWHEDHIAGSSLLKNCEFMCHSNDKVIITETSSIRNYYGYKEHPSDKLIEYLNKYNLTDTEITGVFNDNDTIRIGENITLRVIHTPGHASGHCCFYEENLKFACLSDIAMPESGPWYGGMDSSLLNYEE